MAPGCRQAFKEANIILRWSNRKPRSGIGYSVAAVYSEVTRCSEYKNVGSTLQDILPRVVDILRSGRALNVRFFKKRDSLWLGKSMKVSLAILSLDWLESICTL